MLPSFMAFLPHGRFSLRTLQAATSAVAILLFASVAAAQQTPVPARITQPIDAANLTVLKGNVHPLALPQFDRGPAPSSLPLNRMLLVLQRSAAQETALESLLDAQQDKSSPSYHQWLTPQQFGQQFGPADSDVQTVVSWLQSQGFQIDSIANGRGVIEFSGTAAQVQSAFHTAIHSYAIGGQSYLANSTDPQIPSALAPVVAGVASVNSFPRQPMYRLAGIFSKSKQSGQVTRLGSAPEQASTPTFTTTCGTNASTGQPIPCYGLSPYDFAAIYNVLPLWTASTPINGTGETIAIVARTNINPQDVSDFQTLFGLAANPPDIILNGPDPGIVQSDETESDLDVEWSGAVAPGAKIDLVVSQSTETSDGVDLSALYIVDNDLAPVMSESYGECELGLGSAGNQFMSNLWEQAAAEGISVFVSSGDNGSAGCDFYTGASSPEPAQYGLEVNGLASTPYNVAVGGTDFNDFSNSTLYWNSTNNSTTQASAKGYIPETTWNDSCTNAVFAQVGFSTNAETNCNNTQLAGYVLTIGGAGGKSSCTTPTAPSPADCAGGYSKPSWQTGSGVPSDAKRDVPDVSLFASNGFVGNFYMLCQRDQTGGVPCSTSDFLGIGGTSASSPNFAGIMTLVDQKMGAPQGNPNYIFYKLAAKSGYTCTSAANPASTCVFYDIPAGSTNAMPCLRGTSNCNPSNGADTYGVLPGYSTGSGYDQATGLGSVNAANLVNDWNTVSNTPSTTTLTLNSGNAVNITHGSSVPVSVSVSPTSPVPTGNVALLAQQNGTSTDFGTLTLGSGGSISTTLSTLPGGTSYTVQAHYPGDANYQSSNSNSVTVTVNPEASKTSLAIVTFNPTTGAITNSNATSFPYGSSYILRSDVMNGSGSGCFNFSAKTSSYPCPTGTVAITDNSSALGPGTFTLNSQGYTEYQAVQLSGGAQTLGASYSGDNSYNASSTTNAVTVTPASTTTAIVSPVPPPPSTTEVIGTPFSIQVVTDTTSSGVPPTASQQTYSVFDGTSQIPSSFQFSTANGPPPTWSVDAGLLTTLSGPSGPHTLTVHYSGDTNYGSSVSNSVTVNAVYPDSMAVTATPNSVIYGQNTSVTITATLDTTNPASNATLKPTGSISFSVQGTVTTTVTQDSNGNWVMQASMTTTAQQSELVGANYPGDSNYASSGGNTFITVTVPDFSVSANSSPWTITAGQTGTATITVTPTTNYTSTVALSCSSGFAGETCSFSPASVTLTNGASATATLSIATTAPSSSSSAHLLPMRLNKPEAPIGPAGWWSLSAFLLSLSLTMLLLPHRRRWLRLSFGVAALGVLTFAIGCGGGSNGGGGGGGGSNPTPTTTSISTASTKFAQNSPLTLTANVKGSGSAMPTGTVVFSGSNTCPQGGSMALINGSAQFQFIGSVVGTCGYSAAYGGDLNNLSSSSGTLNIAFTGTTSVTVEGQTGTDFHTMLVNVTLQ